MAQSTTEIGNIGQMYQNRKNQKIGVLESRNEKFKTLMMRDPDGNSFTIVYSTFRSDWRKYQGDKVAETSTQVEEKKSKVKKAEKKLEKTEPKSLPKKSETKKHHSGRVSVVSKEEVVERLNSVYEFVMSYAEKSKFNCTARIDKRGEVIVKRGHKAIFEVWINRKVANTYDIFTNLDMKFSDSVGDVGFETKEQWRLGNKYTLTKITPAIKELFAEYKKIKEEK